MLPCMHKMRRKEISVVCIVAISKFLFVAADSDNLICGSPPEIDGSIPLRVSVNEHAIGTSVTYSCNYGYVSRNSINHISTCIENKTTGKAEWSVPEIACIPRSCGDPGNVKNGRRIGNFFTFPNKVEFKCEEGYKLVGMKARYCQAGGEWSERLPSCEPILCNIPSDIVNGDVMYSSLEYGAELTYKCYIGYMETHKEPRYCDEDGTWSGVAPECIEARCMKPIPPKNGDVHLIGEPKVGSVATFSCNPGLKLHGASTTKCLMQGQWTYGPPKCLKSCSVRQIENGEIGRLNVQYISRGRKKETFTRLSDGELVDDNVMLLFRCKEDFVIVEGDKILVDVQVDIFCNDGNWSRDLHCRQTSCLSDPPKMENGIAMVDNREHGHTIWYKCDNLKDIKIPGNVTCHFGKWIGIPPQCLSSNAQQSRATTTTPLPLNVQDRSSSSNIHSSKSQLSEQCHCTYAGYNVQAYVGHRRLKDGDKVIKGETVTFSCKGQRMLTWENGLRIFENASMTCVTCRRWQFTDNPDCKFLEMGGPFLILDDSLQIQPGGAVEVPIRKPITLRCVSSYHYPQWSFRGIPFQQVESYMRQISYNVVYYFSNIHIAESGYDNAGLYTCHLNLPSSFRRTVVDLRVKAIECSFFSTVKDLKVSYSNGNQVGSRATFSCPRHAVIVGSAISDCTRDGIWNSPVPFCLNKTTCVLFPRVPGLKVEYSNENFPGSNASFSCLSEKVLNGNYFSTCLEDGTWSHEIPLCEDMCSIWILSESVKEGVVPDMSHVTDEFVSFGSTMPLTCEGKLIPEGNSTALCGEQGRWKIGKFQCISGCLLTIEPSSHLQVEPLKDSYRFGEQIILSCPKGEKITNEVELLMCLGDLTWHDTLPDCIPS